ncbi:MAG: RNA polymerase sigma factor, partial [Lachnospiraceae bacterium]|nr:RNA polymerase sigma factor [Lachnospiraceae bacterium]
MATNQELARIVNKIRDGDSSAFSDLYDATYKSVFYHAQTILKNNEDVEDAVQEAYEQAYMNLDRLKSPEAVASWLNQIVSNICLNKVRGSKSRTETFSLDDEDFTFEPVALDADTPDRVLDQKGTEEIIGSFINALPYEQKTTVILYYYDDMSVGDIAKAMGCSTGTVKSRLNYALKSIEKAVREEEKRGV